ncbi:hypothetical protein EDB86DRAFT_2834383 [Lactarius hatsudake]|nr:hypothetical protein EDB86DRAFT_2834383 [Lactarius hatsudake]
MAKVAPPAANSPRIVDGVERAPGIVVLQALDRVLGAFGLQPWALEEKESAERYDENGLVLYLGQDLTAFQLFVKGRDPECHVLEMGEKVVKTQGAAIGTWKLGINTEIRVVQLKPEKGNVHWRSVAWVKTFFRHLPFSVTSRGRSTRAASPLLTSPAQLNWKTRPGAALAEHGLQSLFWVVVMDGRPLGHTGSFSAPAFTTVAAGAVSGPAVTDTGTSF